MNNVYILPEVVFLKGARGEVGTMAVILIKLR